MFGSIFVGQSKCISDGQNSAALFPTNALTRGLTGTLNNTLVFLCLCFQWKCMMGTKCCFSVASGKRKGAAASATCRMCREPFHSSLRVFIALTQEVFSAGASFMLSGTQTPPTHTYTLFCLHCIPPPPSFLRVSIIALITTNKREHPEEAVSSVYTSICTIGWSNSAR